MAGKNPHYDTIKKIITMASKINKIFQDDLADVLIKYNAISKEQHSEALREQELKGGSICDILLQKEIVSEEILLSAFALTHNIVPVSLNKINIEDEVIELITEKTALYYNALPIGKAGNYLTMALADPLNVFAIDDLSLMTNTKILPVVALSSDIKSTLDKHYHQSENFDEILANISDDNMSDTIIKKDELNIDSMVDEIAAAPVVKLVNVILTQAIEEKASDIHIEPFDNKTIIRYRIDGVLYERSAPPPALYRAIVSRIKVISQLDISERRLPQDGRFRIRTKGREIDFRVSSLPTVHGEKIVMRVLDKSHQTSDIEKIGMDGESLQRFLKALNQPHGMIFVTGPTGSGKTTTLYACIRRLNKPEVNIVTIEDPVEYQFQGINQVQIKADIKFTFAAGLRSILRQDPDIVMVGEVRDFETADISVKAALTGHLVLTTLHTNDAPSSFARIIDMGVEPYLVASAVNMVAAQRLARRLCSRCKKPVEINADMLKRAQFIPSPENKPTFYKPVGCSYCRQTGYSGRLALLEVLEVNEEIRKLILTNADTSNIKQQAIKDGLKTLRQVGLERAAEGITSLEEILRVTKSD